MKQLSSDFFIGRSNEQKPSSRTVRMGSRFYELDTKNFFTFTPSGWVKESVSGITSGTYEEIKDLKEEGKLEGGKWYIITNYQCKYLIPHTTSGELSHLGISSSDIVTDTNGNVVASPAGVVNTEVHNGEAYGDMMGASDNPEVPIERIMVQAVSGSKFSKQAVSIDYPDEELLYNFEANSFTDHEDNIYTRTGWVEKRVNTAKKIDIKINAIEGSEGGDYRYIRFRRWHTDVDFSNTTTNMPDLYLGGELSQDQKTFLPRPEFECGVDLSSFKQSSVSSNTFLASNELMFKDYPSFDYERALYVNRVQGIFENTVLKNPTYLVDSYFGWAISTTLDVSSICSGLKVSYIENSVSIFNDSTLYSSFFGVRMERIYTSFFVTPFVNTHLNYISKSIITGEASTIKSDSYIRGTCLTKCSGNFNTLRDSYLNFGNGVYGYNAPVMDSVNRAVKSILYSNGTTNGNILIKEISSFDIFFTGNSFFLKEAKNGSIGDWNTYVSLEGSSIDIPITGNFTSNLENKVVNKKSPDGSVWYDDIDDSGNVTPTKFT